MFIDLASELAAHHHLPTIADDPSGVSAGRLRRTIGPFIRNRPDGAFGLAVVYGHASSIIGAGYGGMKQSGVTRFLPTETADHIAATLNTINSSLDSGGGLSGPAAQDALNAAITFQGAIVTSRDWKKILAKPDIQTYDNPDSAIGCRFYTDHHAQDHERKARELDAWADLALEPEAVRLRRTADEHRATADRHWTTRIGTALPPIPATGTKAQDR